MLNDVNITGYFQQGMVLDDGAFPSLGVANNLTIWDAVTSLYVKSTLVPGWQFSNAKFSNSGLTNVHMDAGGSIDPRVLFTNSALGGNSSLGEWFTTAGYLEFHNTWGADLPPGAVASTAIQPSGFAVPNIYPFPIQIFINGGNVSQVDIDATNTGGPRDSIVLNPGQSIKLTYTVAPTWSWYTV